MFLLAWLLTPASGSQVPAPLLVLISLDGFQADLFTTADVPHLRALAARGIRSEGLIPPFPSKTFPSHYTIVTGLYPERHGIVGNSMADAAIGERFTMSAPTAKDPRWWAGEPVWATAKRQGLRSASMFWPGSEVPGPGQPDEWHAYDGNVPNAERVRRVLEWAGRPAATRPAVITLYFSDVDTAGHDFGPDSPELRAAASSVDRAIGDLVAGLDARGLTPSTTLVVVSDHGMTALDPGRAIYLDDYLELDAVDVLEWGALATVTPKPGIDAAIVLDALWGRHPAMQVFRRESTPPHLRYRANERIPAIVALADDGWTITTRGRRLSKGDHGYDPANRSMHGLLVVAGPGLRPGLVMPPMESVHLYAMMCRALGIAPAPHDGEPLVTRPWWSAPAARSAAWRIPR